jgi:Tfp pilus assembly protein PilF
MNLLLLFVLLFTTPAFAEITLDTEYLEEMIKTHPDDNETRVLLASYYLKIGELSKSELHLNEALSQDKNNKNALILQKKWLVAKKYEELVNQLNISNLNDYIQWF